MTQEIGEALSQLEACSKVHDHDDDNSPFDIDAPLDPSLLPSSEGKTQLTPVLLFAAWSWRLT